MHQVIESLAAVCSERRAAVTRILGDQAFLLGAGHSRPRNYAANTFRFRAASHFLFLTGLSSPGAHLLISGQHARIFVHPDGPDHALWHGPSPSMSQLATSLGCSVEPMSALPNALQNISHVMMLPAADRRACDEMSSLLGRKVTPGVISTHDLPLAQAMIQARLCHDQAALAQMTAAAELTTRAFAAGMAATAPGKLEWSVRAAMEYPLTACGTVPAYNPIVSVHGEVLHNDRSDNTMRDGDLLLVDFGAESTGGWACDVTRTWPVSGTFSPTQRDLYDVVLAAQRAAIDAVTPGVRYRDVHLQACRTIADGLCQLGILKGDVDGLVEDGVHALFFPHGVGHLLGLDVHDMEDLGDLAGYAPGRSRSEQFGLGYLRLDRDLQPGMVVTIEPGFYQVPAILQNPALTHGAADRLNTDVLERFSDVRGIRLEDDILVTDQGHQNLTQSIPSDPDDIQRAVQQGRT